MDRARLKSGDKGRDVEKVQQALVDLGYVYGRVDGKFGPRTAAAVRTFKKDNRLGFEQFGDVGPGTIGRLDLLFLEPRNVCPSPVPIAMALRDDRLQAKPDLAPTHDPTEDCVDPAPAPSPVPVPPEPKPPEPQPPEPPPPPPRPTFDLSESSACDPPPGHKAVTPRPPIPSPAEKPDGEPIYDLSFIDLHKPYWGLTDMQAFAAKLEKCWERGLAGKAVPMDIDYKPYKTTEPQFREDFAFNVDGWLIEKGMQSAESQQARIEKRMAVKRTEFVKKLQDPDKVREAMAKSRAEVVDELEQVVMDGAWGWAAARRNELDFGLVRADPSQQAKLGFVDRPDLGPRRTPSYCQALEKAMTEAGVSLDDEKGKKLLDQAERSWMLVVKKKENRTTKNAEDERIIRCIASEQRMGYNVRGGDARLGKMAHAAVQEAEKAELLNVVKGPNADAPGVATRPWYDPSLGVQEPLHRCVVSVFDALTAIQTGWTAGTYKGHGSGGRFTGRFRAVDMTVSGGLSFTPMQSSNRRLVGFFQRQPSIEMLVNLVKAAQSVGAEISIIYNDFVVAREVNRTVGYEAIHFKAKRQGTFMNWHGPLKAHFHVDVGC